MRTCPPLLLALLTSMPAFAAGLPGKDGRLVVARGIGWSPWHNKERWGLSKETRELDREFLRAAHINTLRSWGPGSPEGVAKALDDGFYTVPTIQCRDGLKAEFPDGAQKGIAWSDPETRRAFAQRVEEHVRKFRGRAAPLCFLLGNEYSGVGRWPKTKDYHYKGFEAPTQARFRQWIRRRFGTIESVNTHCGTDFGDFADIKPLANRRFRYEFWLFLNRTFEESMRAAHDALKRADPQQRSSYAKLMGTHWDPYTEDARLSFLDIGGDNLYWHWVKDWAKYNAFLDDLIAAAQGKPVLITEGGFQSLVLGEERAARLTKQMLWNAFLHPEVAGFCVYAYSDEWYVDGNPDEQAPGESWGIVTADRRRKPSYYAVAEVYQAIEELNDFLATCEAPPVVAVSNQALGHLVADEPTGLHYEIGRVLYANGAPFESVMPADVYDLDPRATPRLIFCDAMFDCEPDGSHSALDAFLRYVQAGGQVLYLSPTPWQLPYGEAHVPEALRFDTSADEMRRVQYGEGAIRFLPRIEFDADELKSLVLGFLRDTNAPELLRVRRVKPRGRSADAFCRLLTSGKRRIIVLVNAGDEALESVQIEVPGARSAKLLYADGAVLRTRARGANGLRFSLRNVDTYALVEVLR